MYPLVPPALPASLLPHLTGLLEINTQAISHNYNTLRALLPASTCAAVLKADA